MPKTKYRWSEIPADHPYADDIGNWIYFRLSSLADDPKALLLVAHGYIELLVSGIVQGTCKNGKKIATSDLIYPHSTKLVILHETGMIGDEDFARLDTLRKLRNNLAHEPFFDISNSELAALGLQDINELGKYLETLIVDLTGRHLDVLAPLVFPKMVYPEDVKYRKRFVALSRTWVDMIFPVIQEKGWTCSTCNFTGTAFRKERRPESDYIMPSAIICTQCGGIQEIPSLLVRQFCGETPIGDDGEPYNVYEDPWETFEQLLQEHNDSLNYAAQQTAPLFAQITAPLHGKERAFSSK